MRRFCPICGREVEYLIEGLCHECYRRNNPLVKEVPKEIKIVICSNCLSILYRGRWIRKGRVVLKKIIQESITFRGNITDFEMGNIPLSSGRYEVEIHVKGKAHNLLEEYWESYKLNVRVYEDLCPTCRAIITTREKAIVQVRGLYADLEDEDKVFIKHVAFNILAKSDEVQRGAIINIEEVGNGIDIKVTNQNLARSIAYAIHKVFPSRVIETRKVIGTESSGRIKTKLTLSVQILPLKRGDIIRIGKKYFYVLYVGKSKINLKDLEENSNIDIQLSELVKKGFIKIKPTHVCLEVRKVGDELVLTDSEGTIVKKGVKNLCEGSKVKAIVIDNSYYIIPEDYCI